MWHRLSTHSDPSGIFLRMPQKSLKLASLCSAQNDFDLVSVQAASLENKQHHVGTEYILRTLGLDICADTIVGGEVSPASQCNGPPPHSLAAFDTSHSNLL
jgi:hypothetical protein